MKTADEIREFRNYLDFLLTPDRNGRMMNKEKALQAKIQLATIQWVLEDWTSEDAVAMQGLIDSLHKNLKRMGKSSLFTPE